jgi:hypothetical protein
MEGGVGGVGLMGTIAFGSDWEMESNGNGEVDAGAATRGGGGLKDCWKKGCELGSLKAAIVRCGMLRVVSGRLGSVRGEVD